MSGLEESNEDCIRIAESKLEWYCDCTLPQPAKQRAHLKDLARKIQRENAAIRRLRHLREFRNCLDFAN